MSSIGIGLGGIFVYRDTTAVMQRASPVRNRSHRMALDKKAVSLLNESQ